MTHDAARAHAPGGDALPAALEAALGAGHAIERELPAGGMGRVFLATDGALGRRIVVKVVADGIHAVDHERFRREILLSARLQHPHIVPVHRAGEVNGAPFFVMPYVEGVSLRARLAEGGAFRIGEATRVLRDVASALHYAHARGIVHRDLKPENVLVSGGSAVVLDFGVARAVAAGAAREGVTEGALTSAGFAVGTPGYMAPEQIAGDPALDHRADLYAFGVLAFELLAGAPPFTGTRAEIVRRHFVEPAPDLAARRPELPPALAALVRACLAKAPDERPADAAAVLDALDGVSTPLSGADAVAQARPLASRASAPWAGAVAVPASYVIAAGSLLAWLLRLADQERVREGLVAAAVIGSLIGLPLALAGGLLLHAMRGERR